MRIAAITVLGLMGLFLSWRSADAATLTQGFEKNYPLRSGGELQLRNVNGGVTVEAWDKEEVRVEAQKKVKGDSDDAVRKAMNETRIEVTPTAAGLKIDTIHPKHTEGFFGWISGNDTSISVEYKVWVPRNSRLNVESVNGGVKASGTHGPAHLGSTNGSIVVQGVTGDMDLESTNGGIKVASSAGAVRASSTNGSIDVRLSEVPDGRDLSFSTTNGTVVVQLPSDIRATVKATTFNGVVSSDFKVAGGDKSRRRVEGEINGGGGALRLRSINGSIALRSEG